MAELTTEELSKIVKEEATIERKLIGNIVAFRGPWLQDKWFDNYTECLYANIKERNRQEQKRMGLNEYWQTPDQVKDFKRRQEESKRSKERAALAGEMLEQNK